MAGCGEATSVVLPDLVEEAGRTDVGRMVELIAARCAAALCERPAFMKKENER